MAKFKFTSAKKNKLKLLRLTGAIDGARAITGSHIDIISNKEITIDGCKSIFEYNDEYIKLQTVDGCISLFGRNMSIPVFDGPVITATGVISNIELNIR